jgi:lysozyme family protein
MATTIGSSTPLHPNFLNLWVSMVIRNNWLTEINNAVDVIKSYMPAYENFVKAYNPLMPAAFIGVIHMMEANCSFSCHLHNGDSLHHRTVQEPKDRPVLPPLAGASKPYTWNESARDALNLHGFDKFHEWSVPLMLSRLEAYNGLGYRRHGIYSPYLFSGTNHYMTGKYTSDGHFDMHAVSKQVGAAPMLRQILEDASS